MRSSDYDFIIVGSGAGGSTLGWELAKKGMSVLLIERGHDIKNIGQFRDILKFYDLYKYTKIPKKSKENGVCQESCRI
jgi:choline dehydrogenase-like flavoprotein